ncbi:hypothetical protein RB195_004969 [Necator americanus]|uniref:GxxExxY protein n=1 Tax=Necator americanus TaxID=51031 RepID=A0ABR1BPH6_NECAM
MVARGTLEAFWINAKSPKMNRKEECLAVTKELALYQDLCGVILNFGKETKLTIAEYVGAAATTGAAQVPRLEQNRQLQPGPQQAPQLEGWEPLRKRATRNSVASFNVPPVCTRICVRAVEDQ